MRLLLTGLIFLASVAAAVLVHAPRAHAAWERPQQIDSGHSPRVRLLDEGRPFLAYAQGDAFAPSRVLVSAGNEPLERVEVPRGGRVLRFDVDAAGRLLVIRQSERRRGRTRLLAWAGGRWTTVAPRITSPPTTELAVADSGAAALAWLQPEGGRVYVHAAVRPPGARRFGPSQRISGPTRRGQQPLAVAVDDAGAVVVAFAERRDLWMWQPGTPPQRIHDATSATDVAWATSAAVRGQSAVVAFTSLEDREPWEYRLDAATRTAGVAPVVETVARNVAALDVAAAIDADGSPVVVSAPIGPPFSVRLHRRAAMWLQAPAILATEAPSTIGYAEGAVTWTEGTRGFAWFAGQKLSLGRANNPAVGVNGGRAMVVWDRGPRRSMRLARFTP